VGLQREGGDHIGVRANKLYNFQMNKKFIINIINLFFSYVKYFFLTGVILIFCTFILFILLSVEPNFSFEFLKYFSFIDPIYKESSYTLQKADILKIFSVLSFALLIILSLIKLILKKVFKYNSEFKLKHKFIITLSISTILLLLSIIFINIRNINNSLYFIFILLYLINVFLMIIYTLLSSFMNFINKLTAD
jgi:hypothetical protein